MIWILLFQIINISLDPADQMTFKNGAATYEEDLSINEIESVYELVSENVFKKGVPESDENDEDAFVKIFKIQYCNNSSCQFIFTSVPNDVLVYCYFYKDSISNNFPEINSPPPKQA